MSEIAPLNAVRLIDSHAHLDMSRFDTDREKVIQRAAQSGVTSIINAGIDLSSSQTVIEMAQRYPAIILAAVGIHPQESAHITVKDIAVLSNLSRKSRIVAIGEIGLDFYRDCAPHEQQIKVLQWQLSLADEIQLPVIIHCRQAEKEMVTILTDWLASQSSTAKVSGVIHCFNGSLELANRYIDLGFYISLGAYIGYPSSKSLREVIKALPMDKLLIETDCPFLPPQNRRGQRNEPAYVVETATELGLIKGLSSEVVANCTTANAKQIFRIPD